MQAQILNIGLGFLEGFALILSPCILPILPIMLAGSLTGSKKRPFGIIIGFAFIFAIFTFFSRELIQLLGIDSNLIRHISYGILLLLGVIMLSTYLTEKFSALTQRLTNTGASFSAVNDSEGRLFSGILFGGLIAIIWTPCAGPILAAVIVQTVIQQTDFMSFLILLAFGLGAAIPMFLIALFGRQIMARLIYFKTHANLFRKILGLIIILSVSVMLYLEGGIINTASAEEIKPYPAPAIGGIDAWINSGPLQIDELKGKVVLIDFWTYSCINCLRMQPYLNNWYNKYHDKGLVIIGVHTPEFEFEKKLANVQNAVTRDRIKYPVALDSQFVTWQNYNNHYWPADFLIDKNGDVVYTHFGEGAYDITENNIRYLLSLKGPAETKIVAEKQSSEYQTPETYLGYDRADHFSSPESVTKDSSASYTFPKELSQNNWALQGNWIIAGDRIISAQPNAAIEINFHARKVYIVMGNSGSKPISVKLLLNNKETTMIVDQHKLYDAVSFDQSSNGILHVIASSPGLEIYTFTFGG